MVIKADNQKAAYLFLIPWFIGLMLLFIGPIMSSFYLSLTDWTLSAGTLYVGLSNYIEIFTDDPLFLQSLKVSTLYVIMSLPIKLVFGVALALLLNLKLKGMNLFRTLLYIPAVISGVSVALMWQNFFQPEMGLINSVLRSLGIQNPPGWFWDPDWALFTVATMSIWRVGGSAVIYLAGLQNIPETLYESAKMDGASGFRRFFSITLPLLTPTLFFQVVIEMIGSFKVFTEAYVITQGGPLKATHFYLWYFYQEAFQNNNGGYASALVVVYVALILILTGIVKWTSKRWVYYDA
jgi:multiple sugar transport system permease protein